jgi:membrane-associated phospholipid phosphatase
MLRRVRPRPAFRDASRSHASAIARSLFVTLSLSTLLAIPAIPVCAQEPVAQGPEPAPASPVPVEPSRASGRRTFRRFLPNLGRNLAGVFSRDNLLPLGVTAGATGLAAPFDDNVQHYFTPDRKAKWLGDLGATLGTPYVIGPGALALLGVGRLVGPGRFRDATYDIVQVTLVSGAYTTALKYATQRERPDGSDKLSFPSGHTSNAFAWAAVAERHYGWKLGVPSYAAATLIGISRMEKNAHHLTDVVAAAGLGYICGRTVVRRDGEAPPPGTLRLTLGPATAADGRGIGLTLALAF